jgi:hypothetical protein
MAERVCSAWRVSGWLAPCAAARPAATSAISAIASPRRIPSPPPPAEAKARHLQAP